MSKLIDSFPTWAESSGGIFKALYTTYGNKFEWLQNYGALDLEYFGNHSGNKTVSPIIDKFIAGHTGSSPLVLSAAEITKLVAILGIRYEKKWDALWDVTELSYDPIENYSMSQTETPNITRKYEVSDDYKLTDQTKVNSDLSVTTNNETNAEIYGFNSGAASPTADNSGTATTTTQGDGDENYSTTTHEQDGYTKDTETGTRTLVRSGNIGVTTSQQMIEAEIALWQWNFYEQVYEDVDKVLCLQVYD